MANHNDHIDFSLSESPPQVRNRSGSGSKPPLPRPAALAPVESDVGTREPSDPLSVRRGFSTEPEAQRTITQTIQGRTTPPLTSGRSPFMDSVRAERLSRSQSSQRLASSKRTSEDIDDEYIYAGHHSVSSTTCMACGVAMPHIGKVGRTWHCGQVD